MKVKYFYAIVYIIILLITFNSLKYNVASNYQLKKYFGAFIPQGWGFFTRNPREEQLNFSKYNYKDNTFTKIDIYTGSAKHLFGLSRAGRFKGRELIIILEKAKKDSLDWKKTNNIDSFLVKQVFCNKEEVSIIDTGIYCIERFEPIPWAWSSVQTQQDIPKKYSFINFKYGN